MTVNLLNDEIAYFSLDASFYAGGFFIIKIRIEWVIIIKKLFTNTVEES